MVVPVAPSPEAGATVDVLTRGGEQRRWARGVLRASRGFVLEVEVEGPAGFGGHEDVILSAGRPGERVAVLARFMKERGGTVLFKQMSPWRPVDTRAFERLPARRTVVIRNVAGEVVAHGVTRDISLGGLAVAVDRPVADASVEIALGDEGAPWLPCQVVQTDAEDGAAVLHLAFSEVGDAERACIAALVDQLSAEIELRRAA